MKKIELIYRLKSLALLVIFMTSFAGTSFAGGAVKTEERTVSGFNKLVIDGSFSVEITQGNTEALKIEAEDDAMENIISLVKDGELHIYQKGKNWHSKSIKLFLTFKNLEAISSSGSMAMTGTGLCKFDKLDLDFSGSSAVNLQLTATSVKAELSGSSAIKLNGKASDMHVEISGAGNLEAANLVSQIFSLEITGSGDASINVEKELQVDISGSGAVVYKGNPTIKKSISGSGSVKKSTL